MAIHHHLDVAFGSLSRLVADKHDRVLDHVLRRLDDIEEGITKNHKAVKSELKSFSGELGKMKAILSGFNSIQESQQEHAQAFRDRLDGLEKAIEKHTHSLQKALEAKNEFSTRINAHRRTESEHSNLTAGNGRSVDRSASKSRFSKGGTKTSVSQPEHGTNDERQLRRENLPGFGAVLGPKPDIRNHPAYAGIPQPQHPMVDQNGIPISDMSHTGDVLYGARNFDEAGWYQQAYGTN